MSYDPHPEFDNFEWHRCVEVQDPHMDIYVEQDDDYLYNDEEQGVIREFWSVYGHHREPAQKGALQCLCDCESAEDAQLIELALNLMFGYAERT